MEDAQASGGMHVWRPLEGRMTAAAAPMRHKRPDSAQTEVNDIVIPGVAVQRTARRIMDGTIDVRRCLVHCFLQMACIGN